MSSKKRMRIQNSGTATKKTKIVHTELAKESGSHPQKNVTCVEEGNTITKVPVPQQVKQEHELADPSQRLELCLIIDASLTTRTYLGSYVHKLEREFADMFQRLQSDLPGVRIAICAHDFLHRPSSYCVRDHTTREGTLYKDFSSDKDGMCNFIQCVHSAMRPGWNPCSGVALEDVWNLLSWSRESKKVLVIISTTSTCDDRKVKYETDIMNLTEKGVRTHAIYCQRGHRWLEELVFFRKLATIGGGYFLTLRETEGLMNAIIGISYAEHTRQLLCVSSQWHAYAISQ